MELQKTENQFTHEIFGNLTTIVNKNNEVFFVSNEVSNILDYSENKHMLERLRDKDKVALNHTEAVAVLNGYDINSRGIQLLTEAGFYRAVLGSKKKEAETFQDWVTEEILPTIRKTGSYTSAPITSFSLLSQMFKVVGEHEDRLAKVEKAVQDLQGISATAITSIFALPLSTEAVPEVGTRLKISQIVRAYVDKDPNMDYRGVWNAMYSKMLYTYHFNVNAYKKIHPKESKLDIVERENQLDNLYALVSKELG
jgi:prophage antirepressor-like protein